jgi:FAD/FMN-containing dehydrogenase
MEAHLLEPVPSESWGRLPKGAQREDWIWCSVDSLPTFQPEERLLPFGLGRSYGDSCLNHGHALLRTSRANRYLAFDEVEGTLTAECGVTLADIVRDFAPRGWFPATTPGTKFVTLGGAIANDVHGKNHHGAGSFGCHVLALELLRSDGRRLLCSPATNPDLFCATIGGLGLTGIITWATLRLRRIASSWIDQEIVKFRNLQEFFRLTEESVVRFEHTVSWVDCTATGRRLGRGLLMRGNVSTQREHAPFGRTPRFAVPLDFPNFSLNPFTVKLFNNLYFHRVRRPVAASVTHANAFFYPLDAVHRWNRIYGRRGFYQWQCVVPFEGERSPIFDIFNRIAASGEASFLAVLKTFGRRVSPGLLSFPREGVTLALDFRNRGEKTLALFRELDAIVRLNGGALYPAKDARMSPETFQVGFPRWRELIPHIDPQFSSSFARRIGLL